MKELLVETDSVHCSGYCRANKEFMRERLDFFIELTQRDGFFDNDDGALAAEFFNAVSMLGSTPNMKDLGTMCEAPFRLPETHRILQCVHAVLVQSKIVMVLEGQEIV